MKRLEKFLDEIRREVSDNIRNDIFLSVSHGITTAKHEIILTIDQYSEYIEMFDNDNHNVTEKYPNIISILKGKVKGMWQDEKGCIDSLKDANDYDISEW